MARVALNIYTLPVVRWKAGEQALFSAGSPIWRSVITWKDGIGGGGGREAREEGDVYIIMADLHRCMAETQHCTN